MQSVGSDRATKKTRPAIAAFLEQARDFHRAAGDAAAAAAKPVLLYYSFLNLAKALILVDQPAAMLDQAQHGLSERLTTGGKELVSAYLDAFPSSKDTTNIFSELVRALRGSPLPNKMRFDLRSLMPQVVPGHRLFVDAVGGRERFLAVERTEYLHDSNGEAWLRVVVARGDLERVGRTQKALLSESQLTAEWNLVEPASINEVWIESKATTPYSQGWIQNAVVELAKQIRPVLHQTVLAVPPYRKYYLYLSPLAEHTARLPQLASLYAVMYYLGSITRYRPHHFDRILDGHYGPFIQAFLNDQPQQFLFLMASQFAEREVTKAALV